MLISLPRKPGDIIMKIDKLRIQLNHKIFLPFLLFSTSCIIAPISCFASDFSGSLQGVTISDVEGTNTPPMAIFTYSQYNTTVSVDASQSTDQNGSIIQYKWDFGDGDIATGEVASHIYSTPGTYPVTLTVIDNNNAVSITQKTIAFMEPCSEAPIISQATYSSKAKIGNFSDVYYQGTTYSGPSIDVCRIDVGMALGAGDISSKSFLVEINNINSDNNIVGTAGSSAPVTGEAVPVDCGLVTFSFNSPVTLNDGDILTVHMLNSPDSKNYAMACIKSYADAYIDGATGTWQQDYSLRTIRADGSDLMFQIFATE